MENTISLLKEEVKANRRKLEKNIKVTYIWHSQLMQYTFEII